MIKNIYISKLKGLFIFIIAILIKLFIPETLISCVTDVSKSTYHLLDTNKLVDDIGMSENYRFQYLDSFKDFEIIYDSVELDLRDNSDFGKANFNLANAYNLVGDFNNSINNYQQAFTIYSSLQDTLGMVMTTNEIAKIYFKIKNYNASLKYYLHLTDYALFIKDSGILFTIYMNLGTIYLKKGDVKQALDFYNEAWLIKDNIQLPEIYAEIFVNFADILIKLRCNDQAIFYLQKACNIYMAIDKHEDLCYVKIKMINAYFKNNNINKFNEILNQLEEDKFCKSNQFNEAILCTTQADFYLENGDSLKARTCLIFATSIFNEIQSDYYTAECYLILSRAFFNENDVDAKYYLDRAIVISKKIHAYDLLSKSYLLKSKLYEIENNHNQILQNYKLYKYYKDSVVINSIKSQIISASYEYEKIIMKRELQLLKDDNKKYKEKYLLDNEYEYSNYQNANLTLKIVIFILVIILITILIKKIQNLNNIPRKCKLIHAILKQIKNRNLAIKAQLRKTQIENNNIKRLTSNLNNSLLLQTQLSQKLIEAFKLQKKYSTKIGIKEINLVLSNINYNLAEDGWKLFERNFEMVNPIFMERINSIENITRNDKRLMVFISQKMKAKEISLLTLQNINTINVAKQRLRKRFNFMSHCELEEFCISMLLNKSNESQDYQLNNKILEISLPKSVDPLVV